MLERLQCDGADCIEPLSNSYFETRPTFYESCQVKHAAGKYVRGNVYTNTVEGYYSIFKRGMKGIYQHCKEKRCHRYLAEYDFRYSNRIFLGVNDTKRAAIVLEGVVGKRPTYRRARC